MMDYDIKDINLAEKGRLRIEWAGMSMPVLDQDQRAFFKRKAASRPQAFRLPPCDH